MKRNILTVITLFALLFTTSCYKEDLIEPSSMDDTDRFEFPQGDNDYDQLLVDVYNKFGIKVIYKGFDDVDFNLSWTSPAIGKQGYDVAEDQQREAAEFMANHIFGFLEPEITKRVLPPYFYVADSVYQYLEFADVLFYTVDFTYIYDGLDYWSFCWNGYETWQHYPSMGMTIPGTAVPRPTTPYEYFWRRGVMLKEIYKHAVLVGNIQIPENFNSGFDFATQVQYSYGTEDSPDYFKTRGFPGQMNNKNNFTFENLSGVQRTSPIQNFIDYLHLCMRYTEEEIEEHYPIAKHPLIHEKYPIVLRYMKDNYKIDLQAIATEPVL